MSTLGRPRSFAALRRFFLLVKPQSRLLLAGTLFMIVGSAAALALPLGIRMVMDDGLSGAIPARMNRAAWIMAGVTLMFGIASGLRFWLFSMVGERVVSRLREDLYRSILSQEVAFFDARHTGERARETYPGGEQPGARCCSECRADVSTVP